MRTGPSEVALAFDIGGSKTHAVRAEDGIVVAETVVGSANVSSRGVEEAGRQLDAAIERLGGARGVAAALAGSAGVDTPAAVRRLEILLAERLPGAAVGVVHDTHLILAAAGLDEGIALISGTGAVAWGRRNGDDVRAGGWGHLLGDEGSGYWVAREALRWALRDNDHGRVPAPLSRRMVEDCEVDAVLDLHDLFYTRADPHFWARRAHVVFECAAAGDDRAIEIIDLAAESLADLACTVADRLGLAGPLVLAGGQLVHQPVLERRIREILAPRGITGIRVLEVAPVHGAVRLANSLLSAH
ncbi:N-acetylglucosamine kinase [Gordonia sp. DT219]|uniref:N-acetylglucosamine kinase n=1 Tax=Gordonia sp. DT219 TaxID=3416658 RepID=UPI003CF1DF76